MISFSVSYFSINSSLIKCDPMELKISSLSSSEKEQVYEFTRKWFFTSEPLTLNWKEIPSSSEVSYTRALSQGLSLKATDEEGNYAAICVNADDNKLYEKAPDKLPANLKRLYDFFDEVSSECEKFDNYLTILVVAVAEPYRKRGLCTKLLKRTLSLASDNGFNGVSVLCTSKHSAGAAEAAGWKCVLSKPYTSYRDPVSGEQLYSPQSPHSHVSVYIKSIQDNQKLV